MESVKRQSEDLVSIIIPTRKLDKLTERCLFYCDKLKNNKEIIIVTDRDCPGYPAAKRNWAMERAKGNIYAFIDSDAYPAYDWLDCALHYLKQYPAVCGPGILPYDAPALEIAADMILQKMPYSYRVIPKKPGIVAEFPTFNLIVRKEVATPFEDYLTGEDSLFCRNIKEGIYYDPHIVVYHNRRPLYKPLWKQTRNYGHHRGYLVYLAMLGIISTCCVYFLNFVRGICGRKPK